MGLSVSRSLNAPNLFMQWQVSTFAKLVGQSFEVQCEFNFLCYSIAMVQVSQLRQSRQTPVGKPGCRNYRTKSARSVYPQLSFNSFTRRLSRLLPQVLTPFMIGSPYSHVLPTTAVLGTSARGEPFGTNTWGKNIPTCASSDK